MRVKSIEVRNFLSFDKLGIDEIDKNLAVIVGPNGVGKSNLLRALEVVSGKGRCCPSGGEPHALVPTHLALWSP